MKKAGFWVRLMAYNIDLLVLLPVYYLVSVFIQSDTVVLIVSLLVSLLYDILLTSFGWGGTIGKRIMKISIINANQRTLSFGASIVRTMIKLISIPILPIGFLMVNLRSDKKALHDLVVRSSVIFHSKI